ncbi:VWA domain-containing protein [Nocardioides immobilis]|uniref:VWA domain-containing protein n=1 Tax=Nocardioides immobilis TaxID=2049295 RepID=A0A417XT81_9ACTN|nr:VWA domain-containing protein [Nocardioides immobilis]RHW23427.1 VWA domain-containing protein [Nocardioides immobilis]
MRRLIALALLALAVVADVPAAQADGDHSTKVMLVVDASASMFETTDGGVTRMEAAHRAVRAAAATLGPREEVGVQVYGSSGSRDAARRCDDSRVLVEPKVGNHEQLSTALDLPPSRGASPIGPALEQARDELGPTGPRAIILVTHAAPTCDVDPYAVAARITQGDPDLRVHVVGLDVAGTHRRTLMRIADAGGGTYRDAHGADQLETALGTTVSRATQIYLGGGSAVAGGDERDQATEVRSGTWFDTLGGPGSDSDEHWYTFERVLASSTLHLHASLRVRGGADAPTRSDGLQIEAFVGDKSCGAGEDHGETGTDAVLSAYAPVPALTKPDLECLDADTVTFVVRRIGDQDLPAAQVEIYAAEEAPAPDEHLTPIASKDDLPPPDLSSPTGDLQIGAPAFSLAPQLAVGTHKVAIVPGETQIFRVPVGWGQRLSAAARFPKSVDGRMTARISVISPNRATVVAPQGADFGARSEALIDADTAPVAYGNRSSTDAAVAAANVAGDYFVVVSVDAGYDVPRVDVPFVLGVDVPGTEQPRPGYRGELAGDDSPTSAADETGDSGFPWWIATLALIAGLAVGAGAWFATRHSDATDA